MTPTPDEIAEAVVRAFEKTERNVCLINLEEHEVLKIIIAERGEKIARRKRIEELIAGSLLLSAILGLVGLIGAGVISLFTTASKTHGN